MTEAPGLLTGSGPFFLPLQSFAPLAIAPHSASKPGNSTLTTDSRMSTIEFHRGSNVYHA
jgi:hypothetical protein